MPRVHPNDVTDSTLLKNISGIGQTSLTALGMAGYGINSRTTVGQFKSMVGSIGELESRLNSKGVGSAFVLSRLKNAWGGMGTGTVRDPVKESATDEMDLALKRQANEGNFVAPVDTQAGVSKDGDSKEEKEIPEVDALGRTPDPTKNVATGYVVGGPELSVVPDVTLNISPDDSEINAPSQVLPGEPVPIIPGIALGPSVREVRKTTATTQEQKFEIMKNKHEVNRFSGNNGKDLGGDGFGSLTDNARVGKDRPKRKGEGEDTGYVSKRGKFRSVRFETGTKPGGDEQSGDTPDDSEPERHPFKQPSLFGNHDAKMFGSKLVKETSMDRMYRAMAAKNAIMTQMGDSSFFKYNPYTQGVTCPYVPPTSSNYLNRNDMISQYQDAGAAPLIHQLGPSPYVFERLQNGFF